MISEHYAEGHHVHPAATHVTVPVGSFMTLFVIQDSMPGRSRAPVEAAQHSLLQLLLALLPDWELAALLPAEPAVQPVAAPSLLLCWQPAPPAGRTLGSLPASVFAVLLTPEVDILCLQPPRHYIGAHTELHAWQG